jgi:hypothetical protein
MTTPPQLSKEELEKNIEDSSNEYNANVELLATAETKLNDTKDKSFQLLRQLYKQRKFSDPSTHAALADLEKEYETSESAINEQQSVHYQEVLVCFRQLQKLRQLQHTYLVGIINGLQKEITGLKAQQGGPSGVDVVDPLQGSSSTVRANNLA